MNIKVESVTVILLAGGTGNRFGSKTSKQLININNETLIEICIKNLKKKINKIKILIVSNSKDFKTIKKIATKHDLLEPIIGGKNRHESVYRGLVSINQSPPKFVLVHDSARPFVSRKVLDDLLNEAKKNSDCVIPVLPLSDSLRTVNKNEITKVESRKDKFLVQTPQLCNYKELLKAHHNTTQIYEDESSLLMSTGTKITTVEGDPRILKITYENDFQLLKPYLTNNIKYITMIGNGFDIHRFDLKKDNIKSFVTLGGINIPNTNSLIGHSDADVLLHAITDSILGVVNEGDIGKLFPPSDLKWKNSDSSTFLIHASKLLNKKNGKINNIDAVIVCEKPKISDYSDLMQKNIARILNINPKRISIKGKTSESIGFIGRQEGIAAMVNTSIRMIDDILDD